MSTGLIWGNVVAYSLQIGLLIGLGALVPLALRMRMPRARLLFWQILLVACLALPWIRTWRQEVVTGAIQMSGLITAAVPASAPVHRTIPFATVALWLLAAGIAIRLGCLAAGLARLGMYRRRGQELPRELRMPGASARATLLLSDDVAGPVTFGWLEPVILLPANFTSIDAEMRDAIVSHELLHVDRRDWLFTIAEELLRAVLWFHPAIWWVIGEIQLAREQTVDQLVIEMTQAREPYVDALLLMAGASFSDTSAAGQLDLAPAPMFLRRRHLKRRLVEMVKEVRMAAISNTRLACLMSVAVVMVGVSCWLAAGVFPLSAAPQIVNDAAGVAVNTNGSQLMHRSSVPYPAEALAKGVEGTVVVQLKLDSSGEVSDASILSGPDELRKGVLQSVLTWHFDRSAALTTRTVNIDFVKPAGSQPTPTRAAVPTPVPVQSPVQSPEQRPAQSPAQSPAPPPVAAAKIERISVYGLSDESRDELLSKLPVHTGDDWSPGALSAVAQVSRAFDSHLSAFLTRTMDGGFEIRVGIPNTGTTPVARPLPPLDPLPQGVFSVGNGTTPPWVISKVDPQYSEEARAAKYSGSVMLSVVVGTDGRADDMHVVKSLGMGLDEKAIEAVQQWLFGPGMNQGVPVKVRAMIEVNFRLL